MQIAGTQNLGDRSIFDELVARAAAASPTNGGGPTWPASPAYAHRIFLMKLYAKEYWWSIAGFIGVLVVLNLVGHVHTYFTLRSVKTSPSPFSDAERAAAARPLRRPLSPFPVRVCRSARALLNIALFRTVPPLRPLHNFSNVSEALVVGAYIGATIAWALMGTPDVNRPNNWFAQAGVMAANQIPFVVALAGKNNVVSWLTGLSHEKLNVLHRAAGRTVLVIGWMHAGGALWTWNQRHVANPFGDPNMRWGLTAITSLSLAFVFSLRPIRNLAYEVFLTNHIVFICIFMVGVIMHMPSVTAHVLPGFVFWAFDRCLRFSRVIWINLLSRPSGDVRTENAASIERISSDTISVFFSSWRAGQHFFVTAPGVSTRPWEAHPFTAASIPHSFSDITGTEPDVELNFIVRVKDGFTKKLMQYTIARESEGSPASTTILLDGPYGQPPDLGIYGTSILIAGGTGVTYALSLLLGCIYRARRGQGRTSRVLFIWVVRDVPHISWIAQALRDALRGSSGIPHPLDIDVRIFISRGAAETTTIASVALESEEEKNVEEAFQHSYRVKTRESNASTARAVAAEPRETIREVIERGGGRVNFESGRPDIRKVIDEELAASDGLDVSVDAELSLITHI